MHVYNDSSITLTDYQIRLSIATAPLVDAGHMQANGNDIRFAADSCNATFYYDYWIESGMNSNSTQIWVKIPSLPSNDTTTIFMFYGDALAGAASDFNSTFPLAYISGGNDVTLSGNLQYDWFQVDAGDTVFVQAGSPLIINSRNTVVNGVIWGNGRGYSAGTSNSQGNGPGGGGNSVPVNSGAGGGGYGGFEVSVVLMPEIRRAPVV